jgi:TolB-like protein
VAEPAPRAPTVFLSYASQDREAARRLGNALPAYGLEVWYDESELGGGDAWDQKIRRQIRECDYFMPLVSAQTEARHEGYFRREWRLAVERTLDMADDHPFLLPVVIDETDGARARVPEKFFSVQWLKVPGGAANPALEALCRRLVSGDIFPKAAPTTSSHPLSRDAVHSPSVAAESAPDQPAEKPAYQTIPFPTHEPGQGVRFGFEVFIWSLRSLWVQFKRLPRWIRWILIIWVVIAFLSHGSSKKHDAADLATERKLNEMAAQYQKNPKELAKFGAMVAKEFADSDEEDNPASLLAMPFAAPAGDAEAIRLADAAFAQTYTRISITQHGAPAAGDADNTQCDQKALVARGQAKHTRYVLCGIVEAAASAPPALAVTLVDVKAAHEIWSGRYPVAGADAAKIAQDIAAQLPKASDD